ncbi:MAG: hypothetical protein HS104_30070 [Polyangiaceae bacterium]|nr:hypothetical protein [Polyangiaceae bacterium]MCE7888746.1 hypothetical protein [Sorangiineae bacterium PRO1]
MGRRLALLAVLLSVLGCGEGKSDAAGERGGLRALPELELRGYLRNDTTGLATEAAFGALDFDSVRQSTDKAHALIHVSGFT